MLSSIFKLDRPLILFDLETTAKEPEVARIVSLALRTHRVDGTISLYKTLINPGISIPGDSVKSHGITDQILAEGCARCWEMLDRHPHSDCQQWKPVPKFSDLAESLYRGFSNADFGGYNIQNYDLKVMEFEFERCGLTFDSSTAAVIDPWRIWSILEPRSLSDAVQHFLNREMRNAHQADVDIEETENVLIAMLTEHQRGRNLPRTVQDLHNHCYPRDSNQIDSKGKFVFNADGVPMMNFGKHKGAPMALRLGYLKWMLGESFSPEIKRICKEALDGKFPTKPK